MSLKTIVKVGNISNLSDARYCAGMGVEMLGFNVIEGKENFVNPKTYQEIRGWVSGPSVVAEVYGITSSTELQFIIENYAPDYLELSVTELLNISNIPPVALILYIDNMVIDKNKDLMNAIKDKIAFVIVKESNLSPQYIQDLTNQFNVLLALEAQTEISALLETIGVNGIVLNGSEEIKPGLKNYDHLADIFEQLEIE